MASNQIARMLEFANLQMASEAFLLQGDEPRIQTDLVQERLELGNRHATKFMRGQAEQLLRNYEVLAQHRNDPLDPSGTGFSGSLFKHRETGELTLSFRSTEFIEDAVRDSKSTNELEVKELGWALGQISDMEAWFRQLRADGGPLKDKSFHVTGYSLGGHLATAFNVLRREEARAGIAANPVIDTCTFNGAGVGGLRNGATLFGILAKFDRLRSSPDIFTSAEWLALTAEEQAITRDQALARKLAIEGEAGRILGLSAPFAFAARPPAGAQASLEYQIAAVLAARDAIPVSNAPFAFGGVNWIPTSPVFAADAIGSMVEVVGSDAGRLGPSFVANSGIHYGARQEVYIEDQPLRRGAYSFTLHQAALASNPADNDFADTHSLVLLVDSLSLLAAIERIDPAFTLADGTRLLAAMTSSAAETRMFTQGRAEGDTLERALDAFSQLLLGPGQPPTLTPAAYAEVLAGNTWHEQRYREPFHARLELLRERIDALLSAPAAPVRVHVLAGMSAPQIAALAAGSDADGLAYRYALKALNPFAVTGFDYGAHNASGELQLDDGTGEGLTAQWLDARADLLAARLRYNTLDGGARAGINKRYEERSLDIALGPTLPGVERVIFGAAAAELISGSFSDDWLFGADGPDQLSGGPGRDYLEGGAGDDRLQGGAGDDVLAGGTGFDTYVYETGDGRDVIADADGLGAIVYKGRTLAGGAQIAPHVYRDASGTRYALIDAPGNDRALLIDGTLNISGYAPGDLGILLGDGEDLPERPDLSADRIYRDDIFPYSTLDDPGPDQRSGIGPSMAGSDGNDHVTVTTGQPYATRGGDDTIVLIWGGNSVQYAGAGDDFIDATGSLSGTSTVLAGGAGNDYFIGSASTDKIAGDNWSVVFSAVPGMPSRVDWFQFDLSADALAQLGTASPLTQRLQNSGAGRGWIGWDREPHPFEELAAHAESLGWHFPGGVEDMLRYVQGEAPAFDDYIDAGDGGDFVVGGNGSDIILGGAGGDVLGGDYESRGFGPGQHEFVGFWGELARYFGQPGDDTIDGGEDDDRIYDEWGGDDTLIGGPGNDRIESRERMAEPGHAAFNVVDGGDGNDTLVVEGTATGFNLVLGGNGDDTIIATGDGYFDGGLGNDIYDLASGIISDAGGVDVLTSASLKTPAMEWIAQGTEAGFFGPLMGYEEIRVERDGNDLVYTFSSPDAGELLAMDGTVTAPPVLGGSAFEQFVFAGWFLGADRRIEQINGMSAEAFETWGTYQAGTYLPRTFTGGEHTDRILGSIGDDWATAGAGNDHIMGFLGNDVLDGGLGDDTYYATPLDGDDTIYDEGGTDVLKLWPGMERNDVSMRFEARGLVISIPGGTLTLAGIGPAHLAGDLPIDRIDFADGSRLNVAEVAALLPAPPAPEDPPPPADPAVPPASGADIPPIPASTGSITMPESASVAPVAAPATVTEAEPAVRFVEPLIALRGGQPALDGFSQPQTDSPRTLGASLDPVYRDIDARLDVLLQAGRMNLSERYAEAIQEFERRRSGSDDTADPVPPNDDVASRNQRMHDWHARHPAFDTGGRDAADGVWTNRWNPIAAARAADEAAAVGDGALANPHALAGLKGASPAPGLAEGIVVLPRS